MSGFLLRIMRKFDRMEVNYTGGEYMIEFANEQTEKQKQYDRQAKWNKKNTIKLCIQFTNNSGIPQALQKMEESTGLKQTKYVRKVIEEALKNDGYLK